MAKEKTFLSILKNMRTTGKENDLARMNKFDCYLKMMAAQEEIEKITNRISAAKKHLISAKHNIIVAEEKARKAFNNEKVAETDVLAAQKKEVSL